MKIQPLVNRLVPSATIAASSLPSLTKNATQFSTDAVVNHLSKLAAIARDIPSTSPGDTGLDPTASTTTQSGVSTFGMSPAATAGAVVGVLGTVTLIGLIWRYCNPVGRAHRKPPLETPVQIEMLHPPQYVHSPPPAYRP